MAAQSFKLFQGSADQTSACGFGRSTSAEIEVWYDDTNSGTPSSPYDITTLPSGSQLYKDNTLAANSALDSNHLGGSGLPVAGNNWWTLKDNNFGNVDWVSRDNESLQCDIRYTDEQGVLKYIGQRQAKGIKTRLDQHLFGKSFSVDKNNKQNGTISKWNKVENEIRKGKEISFKTILIEPDSLRTTIELELIAQLKPDWNIQGK